MIQLKQKRAKNYAKIMAHSALERSMRMFDAVCTPAPSMPQRPNAPLAAMAFSHTKEVSITATTATGCRLLAAEGPLQL